MHDSSARSADALVGTILAGRYRILSRIGEGAMGAVYVGKHLRIGRKDAIKVLRPEIARDPEATARFLRGARNSAAVRHQNICTTYDFGETEDGLQFLAMELIPGEPLSELLAREGRLPLERAALIAKQAADALQAAHDAGMVHRDLKPGNIMLARAADGSDVVKVVDFDIAKGAGESEAAEVTRLGFVIGTPEYMSPEQLTGEHLDGRSDIYALALIVFRMLTGVLPFRATTAHEIMRERLTQRALRLDEVAAGASYPAELADVLDRALAPRPADRHGRAADFGRDVMEAVIPATLVGPARPPSRDRRTVAAGAGAVVVLALIVGGTLLGHRMRAPVESMEPPGTGAAEVSVPGSAPAVSETEADEATAVSEMEPDEAAAESGRPEPPPAEPATAGVPPVTPPEPLRLRGSPSDILFRQLDALGMGPTHPPAATLRAIRDTARAVWDLDAVTGRDRALAAYVLGSVHLALNDPAGCVTWLERALRLRPDGPGYRDLLETCRVGGH